MKILVDGQVKSHMCINYMHFCKEEERSTRIKTMLLIISVGRKIDLILIFDLVVTIAN
jgi:hypothetical protein